MRMITDNLGMIGAGLAMTLGIALLADAGALVVGTLIAVCRVSPVPPLRALGAVWVTIACNIPTLCLMLLLAFVAPRAGVPISLFSAAVGAILFAGSGYVCEAVRSGINSVAKGQIEAARALGMPFGLIIRELHEKFGGSTLFGNEKDDSFKSSIGQIYQTFGGVDLYPSVEEKAAMLLYLVTKNHSFSDGNKRIAATLFLWFLNGNGILYNEDGTKRIADNTLVALTLMIAESRTEEKDTMVKVIVNLINKNN